MICIFEGCGKSAQAHGLCPGHYRQQRLGRVLKPLNGYRVVKLCSFDECENGVKAFGLCDGHYYQYRRGGVLKPLRTKKPEFCQWDDCFSPLASRGRYCVRHRYLRSIGSDGEVCQVLDCRYVAKSGGFCLRHSVSGVVDFVEPVEPVDSFDYEGFWLFVKEELGLV